MATDNDTRQIILDAATRLFGVHGLDGVSTTDIAREAGVNKALIFYYYNSKENLYRAAFMSLVEELSEELMLALKDAPPGIAAIERFVRAHIGYLRRRRVLVGFIVRELLAMHAGGSRYFAAANLPLRALRDRLLGMVADARDRGEIRDVDPLQTVANILSLDVFFFLGQPLVGVLNEGVDVERFEEDRVDHVVDLLMNGLRRKEVPS